MTIVIGGSTADAELTALTRWAAPAAGITQAERLARLDRVRALAEARGADAVLVNAGPSLHYFAEIGRAHV